jgi:hypothetical protein
MGTRETGREGIKIRKARDMAPELLLIPFY